MPLTPTPKEWNRNCEIQHHVAALIRLTGLPMEVAMIQITCTDGVAATKAVYGFTLDEVDRRAMELLKEEVCWVIEHEMGHAAARPTDDEINSRVHRDEHGDTYWGGSDTEGWEVRVIRINTAIAAY